MIDLTMGGTSVDPSPAQWVWHPEAVGKAAERRVSTEGGNLQDAPLYTGGANNYYVLARHEFDIGDASPVTLECSANDLYEVTVNGTWVGRGPSPSDPSYAYIDRYDLTGIVRPGRNVVCFLAYNQGEGSAHPQFQTLLGPGGLLYRVSAGETTLASSGPETRLVQAPHIQQGTDPLRTTVWGFEEVWNLTLEPSGWADLGFDDGAWLEPATSAFSPTVLIARPHPPLVRWPARPRSIIDVSPQLGEVEGGEGFIDGGPLTLKAGVPLSVPRVVLDFGHEVVGFPRFDLEGANGFLTVSYGETLEMERCDTVVPNGRVEWGPYHRRAFRFMAIEAFQFDELVIHGLRVDCVNAPLEERGTLETSDASLAPVWELGRYTLQTATQDYYEADAWRERAVWYCGSEHRLAAVTFGIDGVAKETLRMMARIQDPSGFIPATGPVRNSTILPDIAAYWVRGVVETMLYTGDLEFGRQMLPPLERLLDWWDGERDAEGLLNMDGKPWWVHVDWSRIDRRGEVAMVNFRYLEALSDSAAFAGWLGETERADRWLGRASALREASRARFRDPETGLFMDCFADGQRSTWTSQHSNALAVLTDTATAAEAPAMLRAVLDPSVMPQRARPFLAINDVWGGWYNTVVDHIGYGEPHGANYPAKIGYATTGFGAGWVVDALFKAGMGEEALAYIRAHWGEQIRRGSTAGWELFDPFSMPAAVPQRTALGARFRNSHCHVYSVLPTYLLSRYLLGVRPEEPGFARFSVQPMSGGMDWVRGAIPAPGGLVRVAWERDGDVLRTTLTVPPDATAIVRSGGQHLELPTGDHSLELDDLTI